MTKMTRETRQPEHSPDLGTRKDHVNTLNDVGSRVRRMRILAGYSQIDIAEKLQMANGSISMIENSKVQPESELLERLAREFDCTPEYLTRASGVEITSRPWLRAYADVPQKSLDLQINDSIAAVETIRELRLRMYADTIPVVGSDSSDVSAIESLAIEVRAAAKIDEHSPVKNAIRAAERLGCLVLPMGTELGRHLGMSARIDNTPVICVSRPNENPEFDIPGDRQRFTLAHELGHLALHTGLHPPNNAEAARSIEREAHRFAAAFLAPGDSMLEEVDNAKGKVTLTSLMNIKSRWGIAIRALVGRMRDLGVIDDDHARSLYKQISARGWNKGEPVEVGREQAQWFQGAIKRHSSVSQSGLGQSHINRWTTWTPVPDDRRSATIIAYRSPNQGNNGRSPTTLVSRPLSRLDSRRR